MDTKLVVAVTDNGGFEMLRRDTHKLFDTGCVTVTPGLNFKVSRCIREEFENGREYYALHGKRIAAPEQPNERPDRGAPGWHNEYCFRG